MNDSELSASQALTKGAVSLCVVGVFAIAFLWFGVPDKSPFEDQGFGYVGSGSFRMPCSPDSAPAMGWLALLSPMAGSPSRVGDLTVTPFLTGLDRTTPVPGFERLVTLHLPRPIRLGPPPPNLDVDTANEARATGLVTKVGVIPGHSRDPKFISCQANMTDRPAAAALIPAARQAVIDGGFATATSASKQSGRIILWTLTDDPIDPSLLILRAAVQDKPLHGDLTTWTSVDVVALMDRRDGTVKAVGYWLR